MIRTDASDVTNFSSMTPSVLLVGLRPLLAKVSSMYGASAVFAENNWLAKHRKMSFGRF